MDEAPNELSGAPASEWGAGTRLAPTGFLSGAPAWEWDQVFVEPGWRIVAGVDEAGRGPLAGPVVAAAVVLPPGAALPELRGSKALSEAARERLYREVIDTAIAWEVAAVPPEEIDRLNILRATHLAMARALAAVAPPADAALVDGLPAAGLPVPHRAVVRGDALCVSIAAASVVAKVTRDRLMRELDALYPGYGFARHKGYPTPEHLRALAELGPSPVHRRTFRPVAERIAAGYWEPSGTPPGNLFGALGAAAEEMPRSGRLEACRRPPLIPGPQSTRARRT